MTIVFYIPYLAVVPGLDPGTHESPAADPKRRNLQEVEGVHVRIWRRQN
jgi:hypothetical protein